MNKIDKYISDEEKIMDLEYEFIENFIKFRKNENLSQQSLSDACGVIRETISRIETHKMSPTIHNILKILDSRGYTLVIEKKQ